MMIKKIAGVSLSLKIVLFLRKMFWARKGKVLKLALNMVKNKLGFNSMIKLYIYIFIF